MYIKPEISHICVSSTVNKNLLLAGLFLGYGEGCHMCLSFLSGCYLLKAGVQRLMDNKEILFEKTLVPTVLHEDVAIITISAILPRSPPKYLLGLHLLQELLH